MARLRKFAAYRKVERPYTRISKYRAKSFVRARPHCRIVRYDMGDLSKTFDTVVVLKSKSDLQIRDAAIEAARQTSNRLLQKRIGKNGWLMKIRLYPHHILRENPLASGAGADRMSTGMARAFGKPIGVAAQVRKGQVMLQVETTKNFTDVAKESLRRAATKMPCSCLIESYDNPKAGKGK
jgi:large subunit ribosomal protein L10e